MADKKQKRGLGRGISALMQDVTAVAESAQIRGAEAGTGGLRMTPIELIEPNPDQPRRSFDQNDLKDLASSIAEKGVLQPLLVRENPNAPGRYSIVAGERRWRAAQMAKIHEVPVIVKTLSDDETLEIAIIENVQRADLNPVEEAQGYKQLIDRFGHTQAALAKTIGKSRPYIANALRLLSLPDYVRDLLADGKITAGHARALVTTDEPAALARKIVEDGLTVRQAESLAKQIVNPGAEKRQRSPGKDADTRVLESDLSAAIGAKVSIDHKAAGSGTLTISYRNLDELDGLCRLLTG